MAQWRKAINFVTTALLVVVVLLAGSLAFIIVTPQTLTHTVTHTITKTVVETSSTPTYCIQSGIHGTLYVRVVTDSADQPVAGANVTATITNYCTPDYKINLGLTNSTGYSSGVVWTGNFVVSVSYAGTNYTFPASTSAAVSLVTLSIPSGIATEHAIACSGLGCLPGTTSSTTTVTATSTTYTTTG